MKLQEKKVNYQFYWSNKVEFQQIEDFIFIQNKMFSNPFNLEKFNRKYINNIYGPSILVLAYFEDKCVGARAFWRNDINGKTSYQPCDTAVLSKYRGMGIFGEMTSLALKQLNGSEMIYSFPNDNSLRAYKRLGLGWKLKDRKRYKLFNIIRDSKSIREIDNEYFNWLITNKEQDFNKSIYYLKIGKQYFIIKRRKYIFYTIIAKADRKIIINLPRALFPVCLYYAKDGYIGRGITTVIKNVPEDVEIPIYKIDTLF